MRVSCVKSDRGRRIPDTSTYTSEASSDTGGYKKVANEICKNAKRKTWVISLNAAQA